MNRSILKWIIFIIISLLVLYSIYWLIVSSQFKSQVNSLLQDRNDINYQSISVSGFPYRMNMQIDNLESDNNLFQIRIKKLFFDLNPFDLEKVMMRTPELEGELIIGKEKLNFLINNLVTRIDFKEHNIENIRLISESIKTKYIATKIVEFNKVKFYLIGNDLKSYDIEINSIANTNFYSKDETIIIEVAGNIKSVDNELYGDMQLDILKETSKDRIFSLPLTINNGVLSALFIPILDFRKFLYDF